MMAEAEMRANPLRKIIRDNRLTQVELAAELGVTQGHVSRLLSGTRRLGSARAMKLSKKYGIDLAELLQAGKRRD
jgi:transcriptional regulator with XRE-family HTH domain